MPPRGQNIRLLQLLLSLIRRGSRGGTFRQLARDIPWYADRLRYLEEQGMARKTNSRFQNLKRRFEADKAELQRIGVRVKHKHGSDQQDRYVLEGDDLFMPFVLLDSSTAAKPTSPHGGARKVTKADMEAIEAAARRVDRLGNAALSAAAYRAFRRISPTQAPAQGRAIERVGPKVDSRLLTQLLEALNRRKQVEFRYASPRRPVVRLRTVCPYGLYYANAWWYLVAWDTELKDEGLRNFRLDRMRELAVNTRRPASPDFLIPREFNLQAWTAPRHPWEYGSGDASEVLVQLSVSAGPPQSFAMLGEAVDRRRKQWRFAVRDSAFFALLVLEHAEGLWVASPGPVRDHWVELAEGARARHSGAPSLSDTERSAIGKPTRRSVPRRRTYAKTADQLSRLLNLLALFADGLPHRVEEVANQLDLSHKELFSDIQALMTRGGDDIATDGLTVDFDGTLLRMSSRPGVLPRFRLTLMESKALMLGLDLLAVEWLEERRQALGRARRLVGDLTAPFLGPDDYGTAGVNAETMMSVVPYHPVWEMQWLRLVQQAIGERRCVRIAYGKSGATEPSWYLVKPYAVMENHGLLYVDGFVPQATGDENRLFRTDRIYAVHLTDELFTPDPEYDPRRRFDENGRLLLPERAERLVVRYTGQAARLVAEREGLQVSASGTLIVEHPLLDKSWAVRAILQHGTEAEAVSPPEIREHIVSVLDRALALAAP